MKKRKKTKILNFIEWCNRFGISINMGTAIVAQTKSMCNGTLREMKEMLKDMFPYVKSLWQASGDILW